MFGAVPRNGAPDRAKSLAEALGAGPQSPPPVWIARPAAVDAAKTVREARRLISPNSESDVVPGEHRSPTFWPDGGLVVMRFERHQFVTRSRL